MKIIFDMEEFKDFLQHIEDIFLNQGHDGLIRLNEMSYNEFEVQFYDEGKKAVLLKGQRGVTQ